RPAPFPRCSAWGFTSWGCGPSAVGPWSTTRRLKLDIGYNCTSSGGSGSATTSTDAPTTGSGSIFWPPSIRSWTKRAPPVHAGIWAMNKVITGIGAYLPERIVTNDELEAMELDYDRARAGGASLDEWSRTHHGAIARHWARPGECSSDLGTVAARRALHDGGLDPQDLDVIVMATITNDYRLPQAALMMQANLGSKA